MNFVALLSSSALLAFFGLAFVIGARALTAKKTKRKRRKHLRVIE